MSHDELPFVEHIVAHETVQELRDFATELRRFSV
jgi:hypothetical protein